MALSFHRHGAIEKWHKRFCYRGTRQKEKNVSREEATAGTCTNLIIESKAFSGE
jgi:hypothetical protein